MKMEPHELKAIGAQVLESQPFSVLIGAELLSLSPGKAVLQVVVAHNHLQQYQQVHGGVISYLVDNAMAFAAGSLTGEPVVTIEFKVQFLAPAKGRRLIATAEVETSGKRIVVCRCRVEQEDGVAIALGLGTISTITKQVEQPG